MQLDELWDFSGRLDEFGALFGKKKQPEKPLKPFRVVRTVDGRTTVNCDGVPYIIISVADAQTRRAETYTDAFKIVNLQGKALGDFHSYERCVAFLRNPDRA